MVGKNVKFKIGKNTYYGIVEEVYGDGWCCVVYTNKKGYLRMLKGGYHPDAFGDIKISELEII